jgi:ABC-2 type transport system permease protein
VRNVLAVAKREIRAYFTSPLAYVVIGMFLLISGYFFYSIFAYFNLVSFQAMSDPYFAQQLNLTEGVLRPLVHNMTVIMLLMLPILTMRLFSEEKRMGTIELLLTLPVRDVEVVVGKFAAAMGVLAVMLGATAVYPLLMAAFGDPETGPILTGYLGLLLLGGSFLSLGIFVSSLTENQIVSAVATFGTLLLLWVIGWAATFASPEVGSVLSEISVIDHFENFAKGVLDTKDVVFYLVFSALFLFLTVRSVESQRWRG